MTPAKCRACGAAAGESCARPAMMACVRDADEAAARNASRDLTPSGEVGSVPRTLEGTPTIEATLAAVAAARLESEQARTKLDATIVAARSAGASYRAIGEAAGTSHEDARQRIAKLTGSGS